VRLGFLVGLHRLRTIETGIGPGENLLDTFGQGRDYTAEMARDLFPVGPIAIAQFSSNVLVRFRYKSENGLIAFLAFVFRVIPLAGPHLPAIERVHGGIGVQRDRRQPYVGCRPHPFAQNALQLQQLSGQVQIQRGQKPPEHTLPRQSAHLQDPGQHRVPGHKTKVVEASEPHINSQHHPQ